MRTTRATRSTRTATHWSEVMASRYDSKETMEEGLIYLYLCRIGRIVGKVSRYSLHSPGLKLVMTRSCVAGSSSNDAKAFLTSSACLASSADRSTVVVPLSSSAKKAWTAAHNGGSGPLIATQQTRYPCNAQKNSKKVRVSFDLVDQEARVLDQRLLLQRPGAAGCECHRTRF